ncbi:MAG: 50S ribosomal protein L28 [bacterium]|nr:50S ribosomal protein L28 [bacterium]
MALLCDRCGKGVQNGNLVSHSNIKTHRIFKPNLQTVWLDLRGKRVKTKLCTNCIKLMRKAKAKMASKVAETPVTPTA